MPETAGSSAETILVVDDDDAVRKSTVRVLRGAGFATLEASDGSAAIHIFSQHSRTITAVTLDLAMPTTSGGEALAMFSKFARDLPVVIATAFPRPDELFGRKPGERGIGYVQKPYSTAELVTELRRVIDDVRQP